MLVGDHKWVRRSDESLPEEGGGGGAQGIILRTSRHGVDECSAACSTPFLAGGELSFASEENIILLVQFKVPTSILRVMPYQAAPMPSRLLVIAHIKKWMRESFASVLSSIF